MTKPALAIVGATGIVGQEILAVLSAEPVVGGEIQLCASDDSVGEYYDFLGKEVEVTGTDKLSVNKSTLVVLCAPKDVSLELIEKLRDRSLAVIDCSGLDREANNLRIIPEALNASTSAAGFSVKSASGYILGAVIDALELKGSIKSLVATTLEPVSGAGRSGLDELWNQTRAIFNQSSSDPEYFPEQIAFNVISQVDLMRDDGLTAYEKRVIDELESFSIENISISALRVPIMYGSGISLTLETSKEVSVDDISKILSKSPRFSFDSSAELPPSTMTVIGDDKIHLGRVRTRKSANGTILNCWLVADNIRACIARPVVDLYLSLMPST